MKDLTNRVAIVTGSISGGGAATAAIVGSTEVLGSIAVVGGGLGGASSRYGFGSRRYAGRRRCVADEALAFLNWRVTSE